MAGKTSKTVFKKASRVKKPKKIPVAAIVEVEKAPRPGVKKRSALTKILRGIKK